MTLRPYDWHAANDFPIRSERVGESYASHLDPVFAGALEGAAVLIAAYPPWVSGPLIESALGTPIPQSLGRSTT